MTDGFAQGWEVLYSGQAALFEWAFFVCWVKKRNQGAYQRQSRAAGERAGCNDNAEKEETRALITAKAALYHVINA